MHFFTKKCFLVIYLASIIFVYIFLYQHLCGTNATFLEILDSSEPKLNLPRLSSSEVSYTKLEQELRDMIEKFDFSLKLKQSKLKQVKTVILVEDSNQPSLSVRELAIVLEAKSLKFNIITLKTFLKLITNQVKYKNNQIAAFVFESIQIFDKIKHSKESILKLFAYFKIGLLFLIANEPKSQSHAFKENFIHVNSVTNVSYCELALAHDSELFKITTPNQKENILIQSSVSSAFSSYHFSDKQYETVIKCQPDHNVLLKSKDTAQRLPRHIFLGIELNLLQVNLVIDIFDYVSYKRLFSDDNLDRFIQIDIDDMFVGSNGLRFKKRDVTNLIHFQENFLNKNFFNEKNFKFNLGYSGYYYKSSVYEEENKADAFLLGIIF